MHSLIKLIKRNVLNIKKLKLVEIIKIMILGITIQYNLMVFFLLFSKESTMRFKKYF